MKVGDNDPGRFAREASENKSESASKASQNKSKSQASAGKSSLGPKVKDGQVASASETPSIWDNLRDSALGDVARAADSLTSLLGEGSISRIVGSIGKAAGDAVTPPITDAEADVLIDSGILTREQLQKIKNDPEKIKEIVKLVGDGQMLGADVKTIGELRKDFLAGKINLDDAAVKFAAEGLGLPEEAVESGATAEQILELAANFQQLGDTKDALANPETWKLIQEKGFEKGSGEVLSGVVANEFGIDLDKIGMRDVKELLDGIADVQEIDKKELINNPEFWKDRDLVASGKLNREDFLNKWKNPQPVDTPKPSRKQDAPADTRRARQRPDEHKSDEPGNREKHRDGVNESRGDRKRTDGRRIERDQADRRKVGENKNTSPPPNSDQADRSGGGGKFKGPRDPQQSKPVQHGGPPHDQAPPDDGARGPQTPSGPKPRENQAAPPDKAQGPDRPDSPAGSPLSSPPEGVEMKDGVDYFYIGIRHTDDGGFDMTVTGPGGSVTEHYSPNSDGSGYQSEGGGNTSTLPDEGTTFAGLNGDGSVDVPGEEGDDETDGIRVDPNAPHRPSVISFDSSEKKVFENMAGHAARINVHPDLAGFRSGTPTKRVDGRKDPVDPKDEADVQRAPKHKKVRADGYTDPERSKTKESSDKPDANAAADRKKRQNNQQTQNRRNGPGGSRGRGPQRP